MKTRTAILLISFSIILVLSSCVNSKKLTYLQYSGMADNSNMPVRDLRLSVTPSAYKLMPYDVLFIRVITPDPRWSEIFNVTGSGQGAMITGESASLLGYPVDDSGNIEIPYVGKIEVGGITIPEVKVKLDSIFKSYLNDAAITVRLVNNYISIIGEVRLPGRYPLTKDRINVFEAISMAGDMSEFSKRQKVQLIRPSQYGPVVKEFSLNDRSILTSEFYYIMPNDIIYAPPLKARIYQINSSQTSGVITSITGILSLITTLYVIFGYNR